MKKLILLISLIMVMGMIGNANASVAEVVPGTLNISADLEQIEIVLPNDEVVHISGILNNELELSPEGCANGEYEIVENLAPAGTYSLLDVVECE